MLSAFALVHLLVLMLVRPPPRTWPHQPLVCCVSCSQHPRQQQQHPAQRNSNSAGDPSTPPALCWGPLCLYPWSYSPQPQCAWAAQSFLQDSRAQHAQQQRQEPLGMQQLSLQAQAVPPNAPRLGHPSDGVILQLLAQMPFQRGTTRRPSPCLLQLLLVLAGRRLGHVGQSAGVSLPKQVPQRTGEAVGKQWT
jgi:hypothetical protein